MKLSNPFVESRPFFQSEERFRHVKIRYQTIYFMIYLYRLLMGIIRKHQPNLDQDLSELRTLEIISADYQNKWRHFFSGKKSKSGKKLPLSFYIPISSQAIVEYVKRLNIGYKNLMFASSRLVFHREIHTQQEKVAFDFNYRYLGSESISKQASISKYSTLVSHHGVGIIEQTDYFYVGNSEAKKKLHDPTIDTIKRMSRTKRRLDKETDQIGKFYIAQDLGVKFGLLSGDLNIAHIFDYTAKLLGQKKAYIQGLCTMNIIIQLLGDSLPSRLKDMQVFYAKPVYCGQWVYLLANEKSFELIDEKGRVLAFGSYCQQSNILETNLGVQAKRVLVNQAESHAA